MLSKCCHNCKHLTDIYHIDTQWCLLTDEPVKYYETCKSFSQRDDTMRRKRIYFSTIDKDVRRVIGKRLYKECEKEKGFIVTERSNGDAEYHLNQKASEKLKDYMLTHRQSRLCKAWTGGTSTNVRFEIDTWE